MQGESARSARTVPAGGPVHWLGRVLLLWVGVRWILNFAWEMLQSPLYAMAGSFEQQAWGCFVASLKDLVIMAGLYGILVLLTWERYWFLRLGGSRLLLLAVAGFVVAIFIEWRALAGGKWGYSSEMPRVPLIGVGWSPVLQMVLIPLALAWLSHVWASYRRNV